MLGCGGATRWWVARPGRTRNSTSCSCVASTPARGNSCTGPVSRLTSRGRKHRRRVQRRRTHGAHRLHARRRQRPSTRRPRARRLPHAAVDHRTSVRRGALEAKGAIDGIDVTCMSAQMQRIAHTGYELPEDQRRDLELLGPAPTRSPHPGHERRDVWDDGPPAHAGGPTDPALTALLRPLRPLWPGATWWPPGDPRPTPAGPAPDPLQPDLLQPNPHPLGRCLV